MIQREELFSKVQMICKDIGLDFEKIRAELSEFIGNDEVIAWHAAYGPLPSYPDTLFDVMVLGKTCIYDYEVKQRGALHHLLFLSKIITISEKFEKREKKDYLSVSFTVSALGSGLVLQDKLTDIENIRRFISAVSKRVIGGI